MIKQINKIMCTEKLKEAMCQLDSEISYLQEAKESVDKIIEFKRKQIQDLENERKRIKKGRIN